MVLGDFNVCGDMFGLASYLISASISIAKELDGGAEWKAMRSSFQELGLQRLPERITASMRPGQTPLPCAPDHIFVTEKLLQRLVHCDVLDTKGAVEVSDHLGLLVSFSV